MARLDMIGGLVFVLVLVVGDAAGSTCDTNCTSVQGNCSINCFRHNNSICCLVSSSGVPVAAIVVPAVVGGLLLLALLVLATYCCLKVRDKRQQEGSYNPSQLEKVAGGAQSQGQGSGLQKPPEERLI